MRLKTRKIFESQAPFDIDKLAKLNPVQQQHLRDLHVNAHQKMVVIYKEEIIASFAANGWRHFRNIEDLSPGYSLLTDLQVLERLKGIYGDSLFTFEYPRDQRPTLAEVYKRFKIC